MNCINCNKRIPEHSKFCPYCASAQKCIKCGEKLIKEAIVCFNCGAKISSFTSSDDEKSNSSINSIEFKENSKERSFKATFSDTIGENISEAFGNIIANKLSYPSESSFRSTEREREKEEEAEFEEAVVSTDFQAIPEKTKAKESNNYIFERSEDGDVRLHIPDLNASNKLDYGRRLSILLVYYNQFIFNQEETERKEITKILRQTAVFDSNISNWLSKSPLLSVVGKKFKLTLPGKQEAEKIISEVNDPNQSGTWNLSMIGKKSSSSKNSKNSKKHSFKIIKGLAYPNKKDSFLEFVKNYDLKSTPKKVLASVYYLEKRRDISDIGFDHIYTCLKELNEEIPPSLFFVIKNVNHRNGWIDKGDQGFTVSMKGINQMEHVLLKK